MRNRKHILFTSSDALFTSWLTERIDCTHFQTRVVGDLPREEAHKYFLHVLKNDQNLTLEDRNRLKSMDFSIPFKMSGGMMLFIRSYIQQVKESGYFEDPEKFDTSMENYLLGHARTYSGTEALKVAKLLVTSPGYIPYSNVVNVLGRTVVEEMIERDFLHFRPVSAFSRDLVPFPTRSVVTARSGPALRAMELFVQDNLKAVNQSAH
ncbi:hypothetical protein PCASD_17910 [Puccinia coronata f. sp. avenae]|uniref:Uncharacterized protein n=1 Tax=Puccinia coronata f. sp. avenae TaxID=200324 RepID=A0A2N5T9A9_9BASI|nr:hypothetical protein PCASD_17740 [Puccinia coronata f. sp. avenae]PLW34258.1 hypothetical protein PCASD_17910 [Puccinia coronata f. sp. avenae]